MTEGPIRPNFYCEFKDAPCDDGRCKKGHCVTESEIELRYATATRSSKPLVAELEPEIIVAAKNFAKDVLRAKRIKPTKELIAKLIKMPEFLTVARRRVEDMKSSLKN